MIDMEIENVRREALDAFLEEHRAEILSDLESVVADLRGTLESDPDAYTEFGREIPSIELRLCIDLAGGERRSRFNTYTFRTGLSDYDPSHSEYCVALSVQPDTVPGELLNDLIDQLNS